MFTRKIVTKHGFNRPAQFVLWSQDQRDRRTRGDAYREWFEHPDTLPFQHTYGENSEWIGEYISQPRIVERTTVHQGYRDYIGTGTGITDSKFCHK